MNNYYQTILTIIIYIIIIIFIIYKVFPSESKDLYCPDGPNTKDESLCKDGNGKLVYNYRYTKNMSTKKSLNNINTLAKNYNKDVIWRRYLILAFVSTNLIFLISLRRLPIGIELLSSLLILTAIYYFSHNYYRFHHYKFIEESIDKHLKAIYKSI